MIASQQNGEVKLCHAGYPSLSNSTSAGSNGLYIDRGEHNYPYPDFDPRFLYKPEESLPNYPHKTDDVRLTTGPPKYTNDISGCLIFISDIEAPIIVGNAGFSFPMLYQSVLLSHVFTNKHK